MSRSDEILVECERLYASRQATPRWHWLRRWRLTNAWLGCVRALQAEELLDELKERRP